MAKPNLDLSQLKSNPRKISAVDPAPETQTKKETKEKRKPGRPVEDESKGNKRDYTKTVNIAIPLETLEKIKIAKVKYKDNLTLYINTLIEKDLEANFETYQTIYDMLNN